MKNLINDKENYIFFILAIFCLIKISLIQSIPILNDEAYALTISKKLSLSYFDHPPLTMWILYFFSESTSLQNPFFYRIPFIIFGLSTGYFLFLIGKLIYSTKAGIMSALLYFLSPFFFFSGGMLIVPDGPLNLFVIATIYFIAKIIVSNKEGHLLEWLLIGFFIALAFLSKYQAYIFGFSLITYFLLWKKKFLVSKKFFSSFLVASLGILPVVVWNIQNDFASFLFHQSRGNFTIQVSHFFGLLFAQLFFILPSTAIFIFLNFFRFNGEPSNIRNLLYIIALPPIVLFNLINFFSSNSFAHWSMIGWLILIPGCANFLVSLNYLKWQIFSLKTLNAVLAFSFIFAVVLHSKNGFLTENSVNKPQIKWDNTKEVLDWSNIAKILESKLNDKELGSLVTLNWYFSGQLNTAFNFKYNIGVIGDNDHHFRYISNLGKPFLVLIDIQLLSESNNSFITEKLGVLGYRVFNMTSTPFLRGKSVYGNIRIYKIKRK